MTERFNKAYNALTRAYFEGTLAKGTCLACACGNIIYDAIGDPVTKEDLLQEIGGTRTLKRTMSYELWSRKREYSGSKFTAYDRYKHEINAAGYTAEEFAQIEAAFEFNTKISYHRYSIEDEQNILEDQYNGLCAVVDLLLALDGETAPAEPLKQEFRKHPKLVAA